ncbi:cell division peptidoglycan polymerase FtsW [Streptococcus sp. S784/96/1]|uniref:cell division peptidoglycan polymerase FtsW n=1 Tax=Streptococcus sp. S784/96/1 TaxID=2653499 RepID=UPI00138A5074|nr:FtsW/RodA/SpoVE family cell cycle protein [Streptococcus sp. S784/96/1]
MKINKRHLLNYSIFLPYLALSILGLIIIYSTTSASLVQKGANPFSSVLNQTIFWFLSLIAIAFIYRLKLDFLKKTSIVSLAIWIEIGMLLYSRFFTETVNGAHGWIAITVGERSLFTFQPAEYLKILIIWYLALTFSKRQEEVGIYDYQALTRGTLFPRQFQDWRFYSALMVFLVAFQPDLGNATIIILTAIIMFSVSGIGFRWFSGLLSLIVAGSTLLLGFISVVGVNTVAKVPVFGYVAKRFSAFFNPFEDVQGAGHQLANSYYAMSNGGWFGRGLGNSIEKRGYLPESQTDFVFSIVIEELGYIGGALILALVFFLILRILLVGIKAKNPFNSMMALGVGGMILVQVFVNIGGISGLIPSTGVTFPFLSLGGNSLLVLSVAIAFVLNIDANEKREAIYRELGDTLSR